MDIGDRAVLAGTGVTYLFVFKYFLYKTPKLGLTQA
jgi:hypothetical protein